MLSSLDCSDALLRMSSCYSRYAHSFETLMLEHLVKIGVDFDAPWLKILLRPRDFMFSGRKSCDELCPWCAMEEMVRVTRAHAAEA